MTDARVSRVAVDVLLSTPTQARARVSRQAVDVLLSPDPPTVAVSRLAVDVLLSVTAITYPQLDLLIAGTWQRVNVLGVGSGGVLVPVTVLP